MTEKLHGNQSGFAPKNHQAATTSAPLKPRADNRETWLIVCVYR
jgi:hypothetical protein